MLLSTTPTITSRDSNKKAKFSCDRGYTDEEFLANQNLDPYDAAAINNKAARNPFLSTEQYLDWLDGCRGKKHFQVFDPSDTSKARPLKDENGKNQLDANKIKECHDVFRDWVVDAGEMLGSEVRVAYKNILRENGKTLHLTSYSIRDVFDKKSDEKNLPFLSTGKSYRDKCSKWVASPKASYIVTSNHLFSTKKANKNRLDLEQKLRESGCSPMTVGQRDMAWFLGKSFMTTGTLAGKSYSRSLRLETHAPETLLYDSEDENEEDNSDLNPDLFVDGEDDVHISNELLQLMLDKSLHSWFARHGSGTSAMADGTKNEEPTSQSFASLDFVVEFYEVGLLRWDKCKNIGVSPDGIALVKIPSDSLSNLTAQLAAVEIKTRVSDNTITKAENAREAVKESSVHGDGKIVVCQYEDDVFKKCVPSANRKQVVHQALVTGLSWGVFVTAKVEELQG